MTTKGAPRGGKRRTARAPRESAAGAVDPEAPIDLLLNKDGHIRGCLANAVAVLSGSPISNNVGLQLNNPWWGVLAYDDFAGRPVSRKPPPWIGEGPSDPPLPWQPTDDARCAVWLQQHGILVNERVAAVAVQVVAETHSFHPVREYLESLKWDKVPRLDHWLIDRADVPETDYAKAVGAKWMISAVARIFEPGCKADCVLILEGPQGKLKSTLLRTLAAPWFTDEIAEIGSKDASLQVSGAWIIEVAELGSLTRAEVGKVKAFMSRNVDRYRPPYGQRIVERPRQCVFAGTINPSAGYLRDETGARRFWPVQVRTINLELLQWERNQLWAEAVARYLEGEKWWMDTPELERAAAEETKGRYDADAWDDLIAAHLRATRETTVGHVLAEVIGLRQGEWRRDAQMRVARCLVANGWARRHIGPREDRRWAYCHPDYVVPIDE